MPISSLKRLLKVPSDEQPTAKQTSVTLRSPRRSSAMARSMRRRGSAGHQRDRATSYGVALGVPGRQGVGDVHASSPLRVALYVGASERPARPAFEAAAAPGVLLPDVAPDVRAPEASSRAWTTTGASLTPPRGRTRVRSSKMLAAGPCLSSQVRVSLRV